MADRVVLGVFSDEKSCESAVRELEKSEFDTQQISIVMADKRKAEEMEEKTGAKASTGAAKGAGVGAVTGGLAGLAIAVTAIALPGVGLLVGGPIATALASTAAGAGVGAVSGGIIGALTHLGVPKETAEHYHSRIEEGGILVAVPTKNTMEATAERIMRKHGADQVTSVAAKEGLFTAEKGRRGAET